MAALAEKDPERYAERMEELAYLANLLSAGSSVEGRRFRPIEAAEEAVAACNRGLSSLLERDAGKGDDRSEEKRARDLLSRIGADLLFRAGKAAIALVLPLLAVLLLSWASGCSPFHAGRTLGRGVLQAEGSLGGPFVTNLGGAIPVPNLPLGLRYGVTDRIDVAAHANLLPMVLGGFLALDASTIWGIVRHSGSRGWNLATGTGFILLTDFKEAARISPLIDLAGGYTVDWFTPFVGVEMAIDFWGSNVVLNPYLGFEVDIRSLTLSAACIWFYPTYDWYGSPIRYVAPDHQGGIGLIVGIKYHWDLIKTNRKSEAGR